MPYPVVYDPFTLQQERWWPLSRVLRENSSKDWEPELTWTWLPALAVNGQNGHQIWIREYMVVWSTTRAIEPPPNRLHAAWDSNSPITHHTALERDVRSQCDCLFGRLLLVSRLERSGLALLSVVRSASRQPGSLHTVRYSSSSFCLVEGC